MQPELESELAALRRRLDEMTVDLAHNEDCGNLEQALAHLGGAQSSLGRLEHCLQAAHLTCCILPGVEAPAEFALGLARLSARRTGALVVVEQHQSLDEYIARGTPLDARLSATLLESLFHPGGALHDGAAVVRGNRIMAAGVFLPLATERRDVSGGRLLGARHRAALGLSSISDALVFVVSEETGEVSVALRGRLHQSVEIGSLLGSEGAVAEGAAPRGVPRWYRPWSSLRLWSSRRAAAGRTRR